MEIKHGSDAELKLYLSRMNIELKKQLETMELNSINNNKSSQFEIDKLKTELETKNNEIIKLNELIHSERESNSEKINQFFVNENIKLNQLSNNLNEQFQAQLSSIQKNHQEVS